MSVQTVCYLNLTPYTFASMKITSLIAQHLIDVHEGKNWTEVSIADVLEDVTVEEAITLTNASPNTIASLVHHITFWNRVMVERIKGANVNIDEHNGYNVPPLLTDNDWLREKVDNNISSHELALAIDSFEEANLTKPLLEGGSSAYKNLQGTVEHVHYHLGQIVILKKLIRSQQNSGDI